MLSICIPTYNYDVRPLVKELHHQCSASQLAFEIVVADDCSTDFVLEQNNREIKDLSFVEYIHAEQNMGRSRIRNLLVSKARYTQLLFLDCDTLPVSLDFILNYWKNRQENGVVIGGLAYTDNKPNDDFSLRWNYGWQRETQTATYRQKHPYRSFMTGNVMADRSVFKFLRFDETILRYGHEDTLFGIALKQQQIPIRHIDNPVYHNGLESNLVFIEKTKSGIENLLELSLHHPLKEELAQHVKLLRSFQLVKTARFTSLLGRWFLLNEKRLLQKINQPNPNLRAFDWFKLGYLCFLSSKR
jgi:glycosyltransferase involved in cell wall biosynthesis